MPITEKVFEGKLTWGPFESGKKSNTHTFSYTWDEKTTIIKQTILKAEFWWETACNILDASVYFNNSFVDKVGWWITCEYKMFSKQVSLNNGNNTVTVEGDAYVPNTSLFFSIRLAYKITIQIEYEEKYYKEPGQPLGLLSRLGLPSRLGGIDLSQLLPLLAFILIILILLFRRKKKE
jgi:hypothetical protein